MQAALDGLLGKIASIKVVMVADAGEPGDAVLVPTLSAPPFWHPALHKRHRYATGSGMSHASTTSLAFAWQVNACSDGLARQSAGHAASASHGYKQR
jgi:hypothetical protein